MNDSNNNKRTVLAQLGNKKRYDFTGTFVRSGYKSTWHARGMVTNNDCYQPTLLFKNVKYKGIQVTDHLWFNYTKSFRRLGMLIPGDQVQFRARLSTYWKGYGPRADQVKDYDLSYPTKIKRISRPQTDQLVPVDDKNALVGYIMKRNARFYISHNRPYSDWYVHQYKDWKNSQSI